MNQSISSILTLVLLLQGLVYFWAWVEKRLKPVLTRFQLIEHDVIFLHEVGMKYSEQGLLVPEQILREPRSQLLIEIKRLESRLILEMCLLTIAGLIPPFALLIT
tara:strand:- start:2692 stop:3006 length:315 start_codon:yes stop_codon:yes gene_type:complete